MLLLHPRSAVWIVCAVDDKVAKQAADRLRGDLHKSRTSAIGINIDWNVPAGPGDEPIALITTVTENFCALWRVSRCGGQIPLPLIEILLDDAIIKVGAKQDEGIRRLAEFYAIERGSVRYIDVLREDQAQVKASLGAPDFPGRSLEEAVHARCGLILTAADLSYEERIRIDWGATLLEEIDIKHVDLRASATLRLYNALHNVAPGPAPAVAAVRRPQQQRPFRAPAYAPRASGNARFDFQAGRVPVRHTAQFKAPTRRVVTTNSIRRVVVKNEFASEFAQQPEPWY
eukprot:tig00021531_g22174.t1